MTRKSSILFIFSFLGFYLAQDARGDFLEQAIIAGEAVEAFTTLTEISRQVRELYHEVQQKKAEIFDHQEEVAQKLVNLPERCLNHDLISHSVVLKSWSFDSCVNFTDDFQKSSDVFWQGGLLLMNMTQTLGNIGYDILNCPSINPIKAVQCFNTNLTKLKDFILGVKEVTRPVVKKCVDSLQQIRVDFDHCLGIPINSKLAIDQHLKNCS